MICGAEARDWSCTGVGPVVPRNVPTLPDAWIAAMAVSGLTGEVTGFVPPVRSVGPRAAESVISGRGFTVHELVTGQTGCR